VSVGSGGRAPTDRQKHGTLPALSPGERATGTTPAPPPSGGENDQRVDSVMDVPLRSALPGGSALESHPLPGPTT
jgi:hypothetical protein